jgi:6-phosphofructokinase 1
MEKQKVRIGVMTSGGDAQGMNAAVRAVVRTGIARGADVFAIYEGYQGMIEGGALLRQMDWDDVGGIIHRGGTVIGTARSPEFRTREGRLKAAENLLRAGIDRLVIIGGDGSLTGANLFRQEWSDLLAELVRSERVPSELALHHPYLAIVGLVGSIDNDFAGTDMTIGADSALHRIVDALDALTSTAASHQRTFVVEVMGRHCGYLALVSTIAGSADYVLIPEHPPATDPWEDEMCDMLRLGRDRGRRDSIVVVAEGAIDRKGNPIKSDYIKQVLEDRLGEDARVTILGHVQRGGTPSAFDRTMSTILGYAAVEELLSATPESEPQMIGLRGNRISRLPLMQCVAETHAVAEAIAAHNYERAMHLRGGSFVESWQTAQILLQSQAPQSGNGKQLRIAVMHAGGPAPGMNPAVRAAVRVGLASGHDIIGVQNGFTGLINNTLKPMDWMSVSGWAVTGGAELGTSRIIPSGAELYAIARTLEEQKVDALLMIGGWDGYQAAFKLHSERTNFPAFNIPIVCLPATIDNNLPGSELSIGADTALNSIVDAVDKIKQSAVASRRCFVVEVMGRDCGYLALMAGLASGAERVYLPEEGITLADLQRDLTRMRSWFEQGKRMAVFIRNEHASRMYTTPFLNALFEEEGGDLFEVRQAILGHLQQGGAPTPFDRIQATRLAVKCIERIIEAGQAKKAIGEYIGLTQGKVVFQQLANIPQMMEPGHSRPLNEWWMDLRKIADVMVEAP